MSLYVDLTYAREGEEPNYISLNIINYIAAPMESSDVTITWERTIEGVRNATQDPDLIEGFEYGFKELGPERSERQAAQLSRGQQRIVDFCLRHIKPKSYRYPFNVAVSLLGPTIQRIVAVGSRRRGALGRRLFRPALTFASRHF